MMTLEQLAVLNVSSAVRDALLKNIRKFADLSDSDIHHIRTRNSVAKSNFIREVYGIDAFAKKFNRGSV